MGKGKSVYVFGLECSVCGRAYLAKMDVLDNGSTDVRVMTVLFDCVCGAACEREITFKCVAKNENPE